MGNLKLGERTRYKREQFTCDKKVKLWSEFEFNRVPGDTSAGPNELQQPGQRPNYVTSFSYYAREAGYGPIYGLISTKDPQNEEPFIDYPKPRSYNNHKYMKHQLDSIIWGNYKIMERPVWTGSAKRYSRSKSRKGWCKRHNRFYRRSLPYSHPSYNTRVTRYEYKIFQNESVKKPSN